MDPRGSICFVQYGDSQVVPVLSGPLVYRLVKRAVDELELVGGVSKIVTGVAFRWDPVDSLAEWERSPVDPLLCMQWRSLGTEEKRASFERDAGLDLASWNCVQLGGFLLAYYRVLGEMGSRLPTDLVVLSPEQIFELLERPALSYSMMREFLTTVSWVSLLHDGLWYSHEDVLFRVQRYRQSFLLPVTC